MIGQRISNYVITSVIGEGGMGTVYAAEHAVIGRKVAIKLLLPEFTHSEVVVARFFNEARATGLLDHPGIVEVIDVGRLPFGQPYIVMELLVGETLSSALRRRRFSVDEALQFGCDVASALAAAHDKGIIHRDLKPDNLFLVNDGATERIKILDFGIAKLRDDLPQSRVQTHTGSLVGTPSYMSPEQCRGVSREVDMRTDVYSLGVVLYLLIGGQLPFDSEASGELLVMHMRDAPPPLRTLIPSLPEPVEAAIARALAKDADDRFESMREFQAALTRARAHLLPEHKTRSGRPLASPSGQGIGDAQTTLSSTAGVRLLSRGRRRWTWALAGLGAAAAVGLVAVFAAGVLAPVSEPPGPHAAAEPPRAATQDREPREDPVVARADQPGAPAALKPGDLHADSGAPDETRGMSAARIEGARKAPGRPDKAGKPAAPKKRRAMEPW